MIYDRTFWEYSIKRQNLSKCRKAKELRCVWHMKYERKLWTNERHVKGLTRAGPEAQPGRVPLLPFPPRPQSFIKWIKRRDFDFKEVVVHRMICWFDFYGCWNWTFISLPLSLPLPLLLLTFACYIVVAFYAFWFERKRSKAIKI